VLGLAYRPLPPVVWKLEYRLGTHNEILAPMVSCIFCDTVLMTMRLAYPLLAAMLFAGFRHERLNLSGNNRCGATRWIRSRLITLKLIYQRKSQMDMEGNRWIHKFCQSPDPLRRSFSLALFSMLPEDQEDYWMSNISTASVLQGNGF